LFIIFLLAIGVSFFVRTQQHNDIAKHESMYAYYWLKNSPGNLIPKIILGSIYSEEKSADIAPDLVPEMIDMVDIYIEAKIYDRSILLIQKLFNIIPDHHPDYRPLQFQLAALYQRRGEQQRSQQLIKKTLSSNKSAHDFVALSHAFEKVKESKSAISLLNKCIDLYPHEKEAYLLLGVILGNQNKFEDAINIWQRGLAIDPQDKRFKGYISAAKELLYNKFNNTKQK